MRGDLPRDEGFALAKTCRTLEQAGRDKQKISPTKPRSASEFIRISRRVVALAEHVLVDFLRPLRRYEQVETELTTSAAMRTACSVTSAVTRSRLLGADVVRFVDYDEDGLAIGAPAPECCENGLRGDSLLSSCRQ